MNDKKPAEKIEFKDFLDKCTNLVSLFGIFNALLIYALTIQDSDTDQFLIPPFLMLSIFVWYELIVFTLKSSDGTGKYHIFFGLICMIQLGLILFFIKKFASLLLFVLSVLILFGLVYILMMILSRLFLKFVSKKWLNNLSDKKFEKVTFLIILISIIISGIILKILVPYISNDTQGFAQELLRRLGSKEYSIFPTK